MHSNFIFKTVLAIIAIVITLVIFVPTSVAQAWDEGVSTFANCYLWKVKANPKTFNSDKEARWVPVTITGTGENAWQTGETQHAYTVTVKWQKETRQCSWRGCSNWHSTNHYYEESNSGVIKKPHNCQPPRSTPSPTPTPVASPSPTPSISPLPSPDVSPDPSPTPVTTPDPNRGDHTALNTDRTTCGNAEFTAIFDILRDGKGVNNVKTIFTFNGSSKEAFTGEDGRATTSFPLVNGTLIAIADNFPSQSNTIGAPVDCPTDPTTPTGIGGGSVLGVTTLAATGNQTTFVALSFIVAGSAVNMGGLYGYFKKQKHS